MNDHEKTREYLINELKKEIIGPEPIGEKKELSSISFDNLNEPFTDLNGQEILIHERPSQKYGAGILFPKKNYSNQSEEDDIDNYPVSDEDNRELIDDKVKRKCKDIRASTDSSSEVSEIEFDLSGSNTLKPSSMGVSFFVKIEEGDYIIISNLKNEPCGYYQKIELEGRNEKKNKFIWARNNFNFSKKFLSNDIISIKKNVILATKENELKLDQSALKISIKLIVRRYDNNHFLCTACLVNETNEGKKVDEISLFQCSLQIELFDKFDKPKIFQPYPKAELEIGTENDHDLEVENLDLIYKSSKTFSIGHGCASDWILNPLGEANTIIGNHFPIFDSPNFTPDFLKSGQIEMKTLAGLETGNDWEKELLNILKEYGEWIEEKNIQISSLDKSLQEAAKSNIAKCRLCMKRISEGINFLKDDADALQAFKWANRAILSQQLRSSKKRDLIYNPDTKFYEYDSVYQKIDLENFKSGDKGAWRPFQIAFILSAIKSSVTQDDSYRENVELIFFPTGGGKTEAYLGLSAFVCFYNRLLNNSDNGVQVLMRYTLRLLTAQQFTRAASLICSMELIRKENIDQLGNKEYSIGVWLGSANTPNDRTTAINNLNELRKKQKKGKKEYPFLLSKCPCCSSVMGPIDYSYNHSNHLNFVGLDKIDNTVRFKCHDSDCEFHEEPLPIYVIDEDVYEKQPSILIGTVDKYAQVTWQPKAKRIFGLSDEGKRIKKPPSLILQDELHLITGPLGSMCGIYETLIEDLCTNKESNSFFKPKIVCSTATIRSYERQIKDLYNRDKVNLFPPFGLDISDNFFAKYAKSEDGNLRKPKKYLGICTPNYPSTQTAQVRVYSRLLYSVAKIEAKELQDPWYTLMNFFGSLRELATTITLIQVDIPDRLRLLQKRYFDDNKNIRKIKEILELTSRLENDQIPVAIDQLEVPTTLTDSKKRPIDMCLTSNIIEVGIDIDRLSLITILGQPKTTSSYIQVSGRIGRKWEERPGLVVSMYGSKRPRDKSHFEKFKSYHQKLYAEVEPMSVTPFAPPVIERALHAVLVGYVRMYSDSSTDNPNPFPEKKISDFEKLVLNRLTNIDPDELEYYQTIISKRKSQWLRWQSVDYDGKSQDTGVGLIYPAGKYLKEEFRNITWLTPNSLRNVDFECLAKITTHYLEV